MDAWLIALISGGLTLIASLTTTFLTSRTGTRNLRIQLDSEDRRHIDQRHADERARLFDYQRNAAVSFITAMTAYGISSARVLGAAFARSQTGEEDTPENRKALEAWSGHKADGDALTAAVSEVTVYLPADAATAALKAATLQREWLAAMKAHYAGNGPDPGPEPSGIAEAMSTFRSSTRRLLGVDRGLLRE